MKDETNKPRGPFFSPSGWWLDNSRNLVAGDKSAGLGVIEGGRGLVSERLMRSLVIVKLEVTV